MKYYEMLLTHFKIKKDNYKMLNFCDFFKIDPCTRLEPK